MNGFDNIEFDLTPSQAGSAGGRGQPDLARRVATTAHAAASRRRLVVLPRSMGHSKAG